MAEEDDTKGGNQDTTNETKRGKKGYGYTPMYGRRALCCFVVIFLILAGITALIVWLVYRPHKPRFTVTGAAIYGFNATATLPFIANGGGMNQLQGPALISTTMQFTIAARNPNDRVSIYYDHLSAYITYKDQAITPPVMLPALYHEKDTTVTISPVLGGSVPVLVAPEVANGLLMDEIYGVVALRLVWIGRLKWKAGAIWTRHYGMYIKCDMLVGLKRGFVGQMPLLGSPACKVDI